MLVQGGATIANGESVMMQVLERAVWIALVVSSVSLSISCQMAAGVSGIAAVFGLSSCPSCAHTRCVRPPARLRARPSVMAGAGSANLPFFACVFFIGGFLRWSDGGGDFAMAPRAPLLDTIVDRRDHNHIQEGGREQATQHDLGRGCSSSLPTGEPQSSGTSPKAAVAAVIRTGTEAVKGTLHDDLVRRYAFLAQLVVMGDQDDAVTGGDSGIA